jgi:hypothetical protein
MIFVWVEPGQTTVTCTRVLRSSIRSASEKPRIANLLAE